jgi:spore maturation protein CgeB
MRALARFGRHPDRRSDAMAAGRNLIIINHSGFYEPLLDELRARGLEPVFDRWTPDAELLERSLACFIWFYDALRHPIRVWNLKRLLRQGGVPLAAWNRDAPHYLNRKAWRLDWLNWARLLDIYATHTLIDARRSFADLVLYLPNAADTGKYNLRGEREGVFRHLRDSAGYRWDVSFFGGMNGKRYKEDADRERFFTALGDRLQARGIRHLFREPAGMSVEAQAELIQTTRINLNYGARCEYGAPVASGLPERCYGIPACGGFLLCDRRTHAADDFDIGRDWVEFSGIDDAVNKIEHYLAHFNEARDIAERCHERIVRDHTYANRAKKLHEALLAWHQGKRGLVK